MAAARRTLVVALALALALFSLPYDEEVPLEPTARTPVPVTLPVGLEDDPDAIVEDPDAPLEDVAEDALDKTRAARPGGVIRRSIDAGADAVKRAYRTIDRGVLAVHDSLPQELRPYFFGAFGATGALSTTFCEFEPTAECWERSDDQRGR